MHRSIRDNLERVLEEPRPAGRNSDPQLIEHLTNCEDCRDEFNAMCEQARLLRGLRAEAEPRPGFYARVMERIEAQTPVSVWKLFGESSFGRHVALASMTLALLLGAYLFKLEFAEQRTAAHSDGTGLVWNYAGAPDRADVLVNLVTYQEQ
jgi:predicted anti-sigma-YlaC factor YlaD